MSDFKRFQERNKKRAMATGYRNAEFIDRGENSIVIKQGERGIRAAVVNQQEKHSAYVYTHLDEPIAVGSVWEAKSLHLLITDEIVIIKDTMWHKYAAELCNVQINGTWGRFIGPEEKAINTSLKIHSVVTTSQTPVLVLPAKTLNFNDKIVIKDRPWMVQEIDDISVQGIAFYTLVPTTVSSHVAEANAGKDSYLDNDRTAFVPQADEQQNVVLNGYPITVATEEGFFQCDAGVKVVSRKNAEVTFEMPFGVLVATVKTKQKGAVVSTVYRVNKQ